MSSRDPYFQFVWDSTVHGEVELEIDDSTLGIGSLGVRVRVTEIILLVIPRPRGGTGALFRLVRSQERASFSFRVRAVARPAHIILLLEAQSPLYPS
ncbi:hypothetical protein ACLB2K_008418 [Fragaria x ananassa]